MRKLILLLFLVLIFSNVCYADNISYTDVDSSHWAYKNIYEMSSKGYLKGYEDNTFRPNKEVTREEFAQMAYNIIGTSITKETIINKYDDVPSSRWSHSAVQFVGESIKETSDGYTYFYPTRSIQRQEVAHVLAQLIGLSVENGKIPFTNNEVSSNYTVIKNYLKDKYDINDTESIKNDYLWSVCCVIEAGLMNGTSPTEFSPEKILTRAQAATLLYRIIEEPESEVKEGPIVILYDANEGIDFSFLKMENNNQNVIYSPLSIKYALQMLSVGAKGKTKEEIDNLVAKYNLTKYDNIENTLSLANSIYIRDNYRDFVKKEFINELKEKFNAEVNYDSFLNAKNINNWVSKKTFNIINNMLDDTQVNNSEMILLNALAIKMKWATSFEKENTTKRLFNNINVDTMKKESKSASESFYKDENVTVLSMDYSEYNLEFVAIMPEKDKLSNYIDEMTIGRLNGLFSKLTKASDTPAGIEVYIPKFTFEHKLKLKEELRNMGIELAFTNSADFSNITNDGAGLHVSDAIHKAKIEFDEEGTKAAAATAIVLVKSTSVVNEDKKPIVIRIDKPFMFVIRDKNTGEIWFVGDVYNP